MAHIVLRLVHHLCSRNNLIALALSLALLACSADHSPTGLQGPPQNALVSSVEVSPTSLRVAPDEGGQFTVTVRSSKGREVNGQTVRWSSSDPSVIAVDENGRVTARNEGSADVRATVSGKTAAARVDVRGHVVAIQVDREEIRTAEGEEEQLGAVLVYRNGARRVAGRAQWSIEDPAIASVDADGLLVGRKKGSTRVWVRARGREENAPVDVDEAVVGRVDLRYASPQLEIGAEIQAWADVQSREGTRLTSVPVQWFSSDPNVASVDKSGVVTGVSEGAVTITARAQGVEGSGEIEVVPVGAVGGSREGSGGESPVADAPGQVSDLAATATGPSAVRLSFTEVEDGAGGAARYLVRYSETPIHWGEAWDVRKGSCASPVEGRGAGSRLRCTVEGLQPETEYGFQVVAYRGSLSGDPVFGAPSGPAATTTAELGVIVSVTPSSVTIDVGERRTLEAEVTDDFGNPLDRSITWSSFNGSVASVSGDGEVAAAGPGSTSIRASTDGATAAVPITVNGTVGRDGGSGADPTGGGGSGDDGSDPDNGGSDGGSSDGDSGSSGPVATGGSVAFPGAEGWGATALTRCDRSNLQVLRVTNRKDGGAGSLREAIENRARPDRLTVIVFDVAGYIDLSSRIELRRNASCLYVAGQTAPGDGITIRAWDNQAILFKAGPVQDVVFRYLRFRNGTRQPGTNTGGQGMVIGSGERVVLDHISFSWASDQLLTIFWYQDDLNWGAVRSISVQRTLLGEPFASSPVCYSTKGRLNADGNGIPNWYELEQVSLHHNAAIHCHHRAPMIVSKDAELINNVIYNWRQGAIHTEGRKAYVDVVGNYFKAGPMTILDADFGYEYSHQFMFNRPGAYRGNEPDGYVIIGDPNNVDGRLGPGVYLSGNVGPHNPSGALDNWAMTSKYRSDVRKGPYPESNYNSVEYSEVGLMPIRVGRVRLRRDRRLPQPHNPIRIQSATAAWNSLIENGDVGANRKLNCRGDWVDNQDAVDQRLLSEARSGSGPPSPNNIMSERDIGGFPSIRTEVACTDSDGDGMPDDYERHFGFDIHDPSDARLDSDADGYSNLEEFLNGGRVQRVQEEPPGESLPLSPRH